MIYSKAKQGKESPGITLMCMCQWWLGALVSTPRQTDKQAHHTPTPRGPFPLDKQDQGRISELLFLVIVAGKWFVCPCECFIVVSRFLSPGHVHDRPPRLPVDLMHECVYIYFAHMNSVMASSWCLIVLHLLVLFSFSLLVYIFRVTCDDTLGFREQCNATRTRWEWWYVVVVYGGNIPTYSAPGHCFTGRLESRRFNRL